jgi:hypothetical protein
MILDVYVSEDHLDDREGSCAMIALPSDVSRDSTALKGTFRPVLAVTVETFAANLGPGERHAPYGALALAAMGVRAWCWRAP